MKKKTIILFLLGIIVLISFSIICLLIIIVLKFIPQDQVILNLSAPTTVHTEEVPNSGLEFTIESPTSDIHGTQITIPQEALSKNQEITINTQKVKNVNLPNYVDIIGDVLVFEEEVDFDVPIKIIVPYSSENLEDGQIVAVYELDEENNSLNSTTTGAIDFDNEEVTFYTTHFSKYVRATVAEEKIQAAQKHGFDTGFKPSEYGWYIKNWGSFETVGNCMGMSAMAKFYYYYRNRINGNFYDKFRVGLEDEEFDDITAQQLAGRADIILEDKFDNFKNDTKRLEYNYRTIKDLYPKLILQNMVLTEQPEMLYIRKIKNLGRTKETTTFVPYNNHAVLAYKYENGKMYFYDPNFPYRKDGKARTVDFSFEKGFGTYYSGINSAESKYTFDAFIPFGMNFIIRERKLYELLKDSFNGFEDDYYPEIKITTIEQKNSNVININGKVEGTRYLSNSLGRFVHVFVDTYDPYTVHPVTEVNSRGQFSLDVNVPNTDYILHILVADQGGTQQWSAYKKIEMDEKIESSPEPTATYEIKSRIERICENFTPIGGVNQKYCKEYNNIMGLACQNIEEIEVLSEEYDDQGFWDQMDEYKDKCQGKEADSYTLHPS
ncbi:hypothetical protein GF362_05540 [Candidatus Dojkabacteria bacterium]|nr:hypothetical protein [Candidatus Dojkabacteria bacterium]